MTRSMLRAARAVAAATAALLGISGLASPSPALAQAQPLKLRVGLISTTSDINVYLALRKGYFKAEGLELEISQFNTAARMIAPLGNGQLDIGGGAVSAGLFNANARGIGILVVADKATNVPGYTFGPLLIRKDHFESGRYKSLSDLKGMRIAIAAPGTTNAATLWQALVKSGLKWGDAEAVPLAFPQHVVAFANKAIDGGVTAEPSATLAIRQGTVRKVPGNDDIYPNHQTSVLLYSAPFAKAQPDAALRFMRAYIKGTRDYNDALKDGRIAGPGAEEVIRTMVEFSSIKDARLLAEATPHACDPNGGIVMESLRKDLQFFKEQKLVENDSISVEKVVDGSFARRVVQELGPYKSKTR